MFGTAGVEATSYLLAPTTFLLLILSEPRVERITQIVNNS